MASSNSLAVVFLTPYACDAAAVAEALEGASWRLHHATALADAVRLLTEKQARVLITEATFAGGAWHDALDAVNTCPHRVSVVVTQAHADSQLWTEIIQCGAYDLLPRPFYGPEIRRILQSAQLYAIKPGQLTKAG